jgi:hypothetical protein
MSTFTSGRDGRSLHAPFALILLLWLSHPARADDFDFDKFRAMGQRARVAVVVAGMSAHDAALSNVEVEFDSQTILHATPEQNKPFGRSEYRERRADKATLFHIKRFDETDPAKLKSEFDVSWDGSRQLEYKREPKRQIGNVRDKQSDYVLEIDYDHMLGFRRRWDGLPVTKFLELNLGNDRPAVTGTVEVETAPDSSDQWLVATVKVPIVHVTVRYWIDPQRGFVLRRHEYAYERGRNFNRFATVVNEVRQVDGLWVPAKVTQRASTSAVPDQSSDVYTLKTLRTGKVAPGDVQLVLPAGTQVVDFVENRAYEITEDGGQRMRPLYNVKTGKVVLTPPPGAADAP